MVSLRKIILFASICFLLTINALSQKTHSYWLNYRHGYLLEHFDADEQLSQLTPFGLEFSYLKHLNGTETWHQLYGFPEVGFSLYWFNLDQPEILGNSFGATITLQSYILRKKRTQISFKIAPGIQVGTKKYHKETNPLNLYYSTFLSTVMEANLIYHYILSEKTKINFGLSATHASNGAIMLPNKGLNTFSITAGLAFTTGSYLDNSFMKNPSPYDYQKSWQFDVESSIATKRANYDDLDNDIALTFSTYANKRVSRRSALFLACDVFYNKSVRDMVDKENPNLYRVGLSFGHELIVSNVSLITELGVYIFRPEKIDKPIYQKYALRYYLTPNIFGLWRLKTHLGKADTMELGLGFRVLGAKKHSR